MSDKKESRGGKKEAEELKEVLSTVSTQVPTLIKSILASVFSEEAGRNMGKAAAAYYRELKGGGMPDQVAVQMTEDYVRTFTNLGEMLRGGIGGGRQGAEISEEISRAFEKRRKEKEKQEEK